MYTRKQIPDKMKRKYRCFSIFLTVGVVLCLLGAYVYQKRISDFSGIITIEATESGFQQTGIEAIRQEQEAKRATEAERSRKEEYHWEVRGFQLHSMDRAERPACGIRTQWKTGSGRLLFASG